MELDIGSAAGNDVLTSEEILGLEPTVILLDAAINGKRAERLCGRGIGHRGKQTPSAQASVPGVPVFDGTTGLQDCSLSGLLGHLAELGYVLTDVFMFQRPSDTRKSVLRLVLDRENPAGSFSSQVIEACLVVFEGTTWKHAHVWANPPHGDGGIVHAVHVAKSHPNEEPENSLSYNAKEGWFGTLLEQ